MKLKKFDENEFLDTMAWMGRFPLKTFIKEYIKEKTFGLVNEEDVYKKLIIAYELYKNFPEKVIYFYNPHEYRKQNKDKIEISNVNYLSIKPVIDENRSVFKFMFENYDDLSPLLKLDLENTFVVSHELGNHLDTKKNTFISKDKENEMSTFSRHLKTNSFNKTINYFKTKDELVKWYEFELKKYNDNLIQDEMEENMDPVDKLLLYSEPPIEEKLLFEEQEELKKNERSR